MMKRKAFTLIELLIVVAIIAILAAIAVPNFLEAQARAKVTRVMADMRSIATGLESYQIDNNGYPIPRGAANFQNGSFPSPADYYGWMMKLGTNSKYPGPMLTTPVAYLTIIPFDEYNTVSSLTAVDTGPRSRQPTSFWCNVTKSENSGVGQFFRAMDTLLQGRYPGDAKWSMESTGPGQAWWNGTNDPGSFFYDPTNGTVSKGMLSLTSHGWVSPRK